MQLCHDYFGVEMDRQRMKYTDAYFEFVCGSLIGFVPWVLIFATLKPDTLPIVYAMVILTFLLFFSFAVVALVGLWRPNRNCEENAYSALSLTTKSFLGWIVYGAFLST